MKIYQVTEFDRKTKKTKQVLYFSNKFKVWNYLKRLAKQILKNQNSKDCIIMALHWRLDNKHIWEYLFSYNGYQEVFSKESKPLLLLLTYCLGENNYKIQEIKVD